MTTLFSNRSRLVFVTVEGQLLYALFKLTFTLSLFTGPPGSTHTRLFCSIDLISGYHNIQLPQGGWVCMS
jgi:hypothetical protein